MRYESDERPSAIQLSRRPRSFHRSSNTLVQGGGGGDLVVWDWWRWVRDREKFLINTRETTCSLAALRGERWAGSLVQLHIDIHENPFYPSRLFLHNSNVRLNVGTGRDRNNFIAQIFSPKLSKISCIPLVFVVVYVSTG